MEEVNLSAPCMMKQIKILTQQLLRLPRTLNWPTKEFPYWKKTLKRINLNCTINIRFVK